MPKASRGGKRAYYTMGANVAAPPPVDDDQDTTASVTPAAPSQSQSFNDFINSTDDQKAATIESMISQGVPDHLSDKSLQRFIYNIELNDKPTVVTESQLKSMPGKTIYRTVNSVYNKSKDISYTAPQIVQQIQKGSITRTSDDGGSAYGRGIYFADSKSGSARYGDYRGNIQKTAIIAAKLKPGAKTIDANTASRNAYNEIASGSKLGRALSKCDSQSRASVWALSKGYSAMTDRYSGYYVILNRQCLNISDTCHST